MFTGFAGGSTYRVDGGASNHICMHDDPVVSIRTAAYSYVYGVEYQAPPNSGIASQDVSCVVCQTTRRSTMMIPGRNACEPGWVTEYTGYLAAQHNSHKPSEFICVDDNAEPHPHSSPGGETYTGFLYPVGAYCGSLPCLPYVSGKMVLCAVCTR